ncbi:hypothetical protein [Haloarchaeobius sp. TZWWS8]|uniref:hypothetical protein n=1 Tax=Haloarchaeobius sp. TZWWS8 TaxID=3446121 RepID=UPI003EB77DBF
MTRFKALGMLVPVAIVFSGLVALVALGVNLGSLADVASSTAVAAGIAVVVLVMGGVSALGARSKEWLENTYW